MPSSIETNLSLQNIRTKILKLPVNHYLKMLLIDHIDLAIHYYKNKESLSVLNCLSVLIQRIPAQFLQNIFLYKHFEPLLADIHLLQQVLNEAPLPPNSNNSPEFTAPQNSTAVSNLSFPDPIESNLIESEKIESDPMESEKIESDPMESDPIKSNQIGPNPIKPDLTAPVATIPPINSPRPEKNYLKWNFPAGPSKLN